MKCDEKIRGKRKARVERVEDRKRERERDRGWFSVRRLSFSLSLCLPSLSLWLFVFASLSGTCSQPERKSNCFTTINDIRLCRWNNVLAPLSILAWKCSPNLGIVEWNLFTSWIWREEIDRKFFVSISTKDYSRSVYSIVRINARLISKILFIVELMYVSFIIFFINLLWFWYIYQIKF